MFTLYAAFRRVPVSVLPCFLLTIVGALFFPAAGRDDAHITYWVARRLMESGRIVNYNGQPVEQSSSLFHVLVLATLAAAGRVARSGIDMVLLARVSTLLFGLAAVIAVQCLANRIQTGLAGFAGLLTATSAYFIYWSYGGLESTLCAFTILVLLLSFGAYLKAAPGSSGRAAGAILGCVLAAVAFILTRPENPLVLAATLAAAGTMLFGPGRRDPGQTVAGQSGRFLVLTCVSLAAITGLFCLRWICFGSLFPQPVIAKSGHLDVHTLIHGLRYCRAQLVHEPGAGIFALTALAGAGIAAREQWRGKGAANPYVVLSLFYFLVDGAFVVCAGGDWMEAGRFFVPLWPVAAIFASYALIRLASSGRPAWIRWALAAAIILIQASTIYDVAAHDSTSLPIWSRTSTEPYASAAALDFSWFERHNRVNLRDIPTLLRLDGIVSQLAAARPNGLVCVMSGQMGMISYYLEGRRPGHIRILDRRGLVERTFTNCALTSRLPRGNGGLQMDYEFYFAHRALLEAQCAVPRPDVIFDLDNFPSVAAADYKEVYKQGGQICSDSRWLPGKTVTGMQFIAVRRDLLSALEKK